MRTLWGTLLAIGTMLPGITHAQDTVDQRPSRERPEKIGDPRIERQELRARADDGEQASNARPEREGGQGREDRAQPAVQPAFEQTPLARPERDGGRGREDRALPTVQPSPRPAPRSADNGAWRGQQRDDDRPGGDEAQRNLARDRGESRGRNRGEQIFQPSPDRIDERVENDRRDRSTLRPGTYAGRGTDRADSADHGRFDRDDRRRQFDRGGAYGGDFARDADRFDDRRVWYRGWRSDARYDWSRNRATNRSAYRLPRYYAPGGWGYGYRRFSVGVTLFSGLFGQNYWIDDPWTYRLPVAYGPYRWVRYYGDALLVDVRTGRIVDTVYDIFG